MNPSAGSAPRPDEQVDDVAVDLLVIGGGMAGLTAAARAAADGLQVLVVEKAPRIGGSALLSAGRIIAPVSADELRRVNPSGDAVLNQVLVDEIEHLFTWCRQVGATISEPRDGQRMLGAPPDQVLGLDVHGRELDMGSYLDRCAATIARASGSVVTGAETRQLLLEEGRVCGAVVSDRDGEVVVHARWTLLATGGFQNDRHLRTLLIGPSALTMPVRSNRHSTGEGLALALQAGAALSGPMDGFYGHPMPWPLPDPFEERHYSPLSLNRVAPFGVVLDRSGRRTFDESVGYWACAQGIADLTDARALIVGDERLINPRDQHGAANGSSADQIRAAQQAGGNVVVGDDLDVVARAVLGWGYRDVKRGIERFNEHVTSRGPATPARSRNRHGIVAPPFVAVECQAAITGTWGGIRIDVGARVLDETGRAVPGLLAAGNDAGGFYREGYCGGLGVAGVFGLRAAATALRS